MTSIDDHGRRAGADLRRSANRGDRPPIADLAARPHGRTRRAAAVGVAATLVVAAAWASNRPDDGAETVEVRGPAVLERAEAPTESSDGRTDGAATGSLDPTTGAPDPAPGGGVTERAGTGATGTAPPSSSGTAAGSDDRSVATPPAAGPPTTAPPPADPPSDTPPVTAPPTTAPPVTDPPPTTPPTTAPPPPGTLVPSSPAWASTCAATERFLDAARAIDDGTSDDILAVAVPFIEAISAIPAGVADDEVAYTAALVDAIERGIRVAPYAADFVGNAGSLLDVIAVGCGTPAGLPVPSSTVPLLYDVIFLSGVF